MKGLVLVLGALLVAVVAAPPARAAQAWVKRALEIGDRDPGRRIDPPKIARYTVDAGGDFVLDRSGRTPLLKLDDNPEVFALAASRGPRGDVIYRNDLDEPVLRSTKLGGMTIFTVRNPDGAAAALVGQGAPLGLVPMSSVALYRRLVEASVRSSRVSQRLIGFDAPQVDPSADGLVADTATLASNAVVRLAAKPGGKVALSRITKIIFTVGKHPDVIVRGPVITISVTPSDGLAGRPSSSRIGLALEGR